MYHQCSSYLTVNQPFIKFSHVIGGCNIEGEEDGWDFGTGAGFYVNATQEKWKNNYRMYSYVTEEVMAALYFKSERMKIVCSIVNCFLCPLKKLLTLYIFYFSFQHLLMQIFLFLETNRVYLDTGIFLNSYINTAFSNLSVIGLFLYTCNSGNCIIKNCKENPCCNHGVPFLCINSYHPV